MECSGQLNHSHHDPDWSASPRPPPGPGRCQVARPLIDLSALVQPGKGCTAHTHLMPGMDDPVPSALPGAAGCGVRREGHRPHVPDHQPPASWHRQHHRHRSLPRHRHPHRDTWPPSAPAGYEPASRPPSSPLAPSVPPSTPLSTPSAPIGWPPTRLTACTHVLEVFLVVLLSLVPRLPLLPAFITSPATRRAAKRWSPAA